MGDQSLKKLIKGANKKISDGGSILLEKAKSKDWQGNVEEVVGILNKHKDLFDSEFDSQLPSLEKHLATRDADNLIALCEVIDDRLSFLDSKLNPPEEDSIGEAELSAENPTEAPPEEEDFAALLQQKSVDEMSEEERKAIDLNTEDGAQEHDDELSNLMQGDDAPLISSEPSPVEEAKDGDEPPLLDQEENPPSAEPEEDVDYSAILEQKSVDEMDESEIDSIAMDEAAAAAAKEQSIEQDTSEAVVPEEEQQVEADSVEPESITQDSGESEDSPAVEVEQNIEEDVASEGSEDLTENTGEDDAPVPEVMSMEEETSETESAVGLDSEPPSDLDDLLAEEEANRQSEEAPAETTQESVEELEGLLLEESEEPAEEQNESEIAPETNETEPSEQLDSEPAQEDNQVSDELEALSNDELNASEPSAEGEEIYSAQEDQDAEPPIENESPSVESPIEPSTNSGENEMSAADEVINEDSLDDLIAESELTQESDSSSEAEVSDTLDDLIAESEQEIAETEENTEAKNLDELLTDESAAEETNPETVEVGEVEEPAQEAPSEPAEGNITTMEDLDDLLGDDQPSLEQLDEQAPSANDLLEELEGEQVDEASMEESQDEGLASDTDILEPDEGPDTEIAGTDDILSDLEDMGPDESNKNVDDLLADVQTDISEDVSVTEMLDTLEDTEQKNVEDEEGTEVEDLHDLLSDVTGRTITEDDLKTDNVDASVSLTDLVKDAESSLSEGETQSERILSQSFRLEVDGEVSYDGDNEDEVKRMVADHILSGSTSEIKLLKIQKKEIVTVVEEECPITVNIQSDS